MKTSYIKQTKIECSLDHDLTMSTPVMNGRTLPIQMINENPFQSPAFTLTPKMNVAQINKNDDFSHALTSLRGMMGKNPISNNNNLSNSNEKQDKLKISNSKKTEEMEKSKCDMDINPEKANNYNSATYSEYIKKRTLPSNTSENNMNSLPYCNKIVKPKNGSNNSSLNNLQEKNTEKSDKNINKNSKDDKSIKFEEMKGPEIVENGGRKKDEGKVLNIKSKLKQFDL